jgi:oligopeptide/dipeptide ABC transporter ATP-binding protein
MSNLLEIENLKVHFPLPQGVVELLARKPRRVVKAVNGVSFKLGQGQTLGLVGESGCGKTTLSRAMLGLVDVAGGSVRFDGQDVLGQDRAARLALRRRAQMVFQDPFASLNPKMSVGGTLAEVLKFHRMCRPREVPARVAELMEMVGLPRELSDHKPSELSGGQCQRVGVARALAVGPDLLVADESVSALDVSIQAQILNLFLNLQQEMGLTMVFIAHDLGVVWHLCQTIAVMYLGRIVEIGAANEIFQNPRHPYTRALISAIPKMHPEASLSADLLSGEPPSPLDIPGGCAFHPRCPRVMTRCRSGPAPELIDMGPIQVACYLYDTEQR